MIAVDEMLKTLAAANGKGLRMAAGAAAQILDASGSTHAASPNAMTRQEILQLIVPIVPEHARRRLPQENSVDFDYSSPSGPFKVTILRNGQEIAVSFVPDGDACALPWCLWRLWCLWCLRCRRCLRCRQCLRCRRRLFLLCRRLRRRRASSRPLPARRRSIACSD